VPLWRRARPRSAMFFGTPSTAVVALVASWFQLPGRAGEKRKDEVPRHEKSLAVDRHSATRGLGTSSPHELTRTRRLTAMHQAASLTAVPPWVTRARLTSRRSKVAARAFRPTKSVVGLVVIGAGPSEELTKETIIVDATLDDDRAEANAPNAFFARASRALLSTAAATLVAVCTTGAVTPPGAHAITSNNLLFLEAWRAVDKAYVDKTFNGVSWFKYREETVKRTPMDSTEETYDAIRVMLGKLDDPFTRFLEPEKYALLTDSTMSANITGVGVEMAYGDDGGVVVVAPTPGGPADEAGVKPADRILAVDGRPVEGLSLYEVADALQGPATSKVAVRLGRGSGMETQVVRDVSITRRKYALVPVRAQLCAPASGTDTKIEYIRLTTFNQLSGKKVREAVTSGLENGADAFVLDLRSNSGGLFPGALEIAKQFMNKGTIVLIADSDGVRDVFESDNTAIVPVNVPLTLLVDKGTASASEVLAGALRDNKRATILGDTETFGKGLIQTVVPLADGSAVSVTVARYQTPSGADINKVGISPDGPLPTVASLDGEPDGENAAAETGKRSGGVLPSEPGSFCAVVERDENVARKLFS